MKCTQPGCSGTIVDGYCDVCGMAGVLDGPTARRSRPPMRRSRQARPRPLADGTPCAQPGCAGKILDGYCDICGTAADSKPAPSSW